MLFVIFLGQIAQYPCKSPIACYIGLYRSEKFDLRTPNAIGVHMDETEAVMASSTHQTAKIYQFPTAAERKALASERSKATLAQTKADMSLADLASGGAWYHEDAMKDAQPKHLWRG